MGSAFLAVVSLNTLPGVGGTAGGAELAGLALNVNTEATFPGSGGFVPLLASGPAPKEKRGFAVVLAGPNAGGLAIPLWACFPPLVTPNNPVGSLFASVGCPLVVELASPTLKTEGVDLTPLAGVPAGLLPKSDGGFTCVAVVLGPGALPNRFVTGCAVGTDELFGIPKLNIGFDAESDTVAAAGGLDWLTLVSLLVTPKLNFGFDVSPELPTVGALALGLELVLGGFEGCENEKKP